MIQVKTLLKVKDNSGVKKVECIKVLKNKIGKIGSIVLVSIKKIKQSPTKKNKFQKGDVVKGLIIQTKSSYKNKIGNIIKFDTNSIILLDTQNRPISTKILGLISDTFRQNKNFKIISLSFNII